MKMKFYRLSENRIKRVLKNPHRLEEGIAPDTAAAMQPSSFKTRGGIKNWNQEIWVMFRTAKPRVGKGKSKIKIISAWRYPGKTKSRDSLPGEILREINEGLKGM